MAKQTINKGTYPDDPSADNISTAFEKVNNNFDEVYQADLDEITNRTAADAALKSQIDDLEASQNAGAIGFDTKSNMDGDLDHDAGTIAQVMNDATAANNGYYRKSGASGSGSWVKRDDFYANTVDPDGTSEAVTGKAVGDYIDQEAGAAIASEVVVGFEEYEGFIEGKEVDHIIQGQNGKGLIVFFKDGTSKNYYSAITDDIDDPSDYAESEVYGFKTTNGVAIFQIGSDGKVKIPNLAQDDFDGVPLRSTPDLVMYGDSLTDGAGATSLQGVPYLLAQHFAPGSSNGFRMVENQGIGGQKALQIATRMGAYDVMISLDSEALPKSGSTNVTIEIGANFLYNEIFAKQQRGWLEISGTRYYGTLTRPAGSGSQQYTFARFNPGSEITSLTGNYRWIPDNDHLLKRTAVIWVGRNDSGQANMANDVLEGVNAIVANLSPIKPNFLVLSVLFDSSETSGTTDRGYVEKTNELLKLNFPANYLHVSDLVDDPTYRSDSVHLNDAGYALIRDEIIKKLNQRGY